jgi:hypothetical protein
MPIAMQLELTPRQKRLIVVSLREKRDELEKILGDEALDDGTRHLIQYDHDSVQELLVRFRTR